MPEPAAPSPRPSPAAEDYLKAVWSAQEWSTSPVSTSDLAERLGVARSTVSEMVRRLTDQGLLVHVAYGSVGLTADGHARAVDVVRRHRLLETFLVEVLGYTWDEVHDEAEVLEHAVSDRFVAAVADVLGDPVRDPHGDPIPRADGGLDRPDAVRLSEVAGGRTVRVVRVSDADPELLRHLAGLGIRPDVTLAVVEQQAFAGLVVVDVDGRRERLGTPAAAAIWTAPAR